MKFKTYLQQLNKFAEKHPEALELEAIYSADDEGNSYSNIIFGDPEKVEVQLEKHMLIDPFNIKFDSDNPNAIIIN